MNDYKYVPIVTWPGAPTKNRRESLFRAKYGDTLELLDRELEKLRATEIVLQVALEPREIRLDGKPRADAKPSHPGIILTFKTKDGPHSFPCDTYTTWKDNLRAIALTLEHLRAIDRFGVTKRGEQYAGWKQLPPAGREMTGMSIEAASQILARHAHSDESCDDILASSVCRESAYKKAVIRTHPDKTGGSDSAFIEVQRAVEVLRGAAG